MPLFVSVLKSLYFFFRNKNLSSNSKWGDTYQSSTIYFGWKPSNIFKIQVFLWEGSGSNPRHVQVCLCFLYFFMKWCHLMFVKYILHTLSTNVCDIVAQRDFVKRKSNYYCSKNSELMIKTYVCKFSKYPNFSRLV